MAAANPPIPAPTMTAALGVNAECRMPNAENGQYQMPKMANVGMSVGISTFIIDHFRHSAFGIQH
jgi:hypothetical protein